ncbi:MAG: PfkB family carbohydrate kinase [Alphaproteobacteria bacterium]
MAKILCIGAAHFDIHMKCMKKFITGQSNPVKSLYSMGGVACNMALHLAHLDHQVAMKSLTGSDTTIAPQMQDHGVDTSMIDVVPDGISASYISALDKDGFVIMGLANMQLYNQMGASFVRRHCARALKYPHWVIDLNLPEEGVEAVKEVMTDDQKCYVSMASPAKAKRMFPILSRADALFGCAAEYSEALNQDIDSIEAAKATVRDMLDRGPKHVFLTMGKDGVVAGHGDTVKHWPALPVEVKNDAGGGDAFASGAIDGLINDLPLETVVGQGLVAATYAVSCPYTSQGYMSRAEMINYRAA